ncbi:DUF721 domain-containing protein [Streptomyces sp. CAU 1734]|uniref:DUF721 domain-containing protein n=1 Tax=Streptomyces sp. CAU 1734 TaxID=3140360 RepID=UPI003260930E
MSGDEPAGVDLARVALAAARKAAKERGASPSVKRTTPRRSARANGRDPLGLAGALAQLVTERGWSTPAAGGSVISRWQSIVPPEVAEHLRAVAFDAPTGRLDLVPDTNAWATQARLISAQLVRQANTAIGAETVRRIRVLAVGSHASATRTEPSPATPAAAPRSEVRTPATASTGYHRARAAIASTPAAPPRGPVRTRDDGCDGYHQTRAALANRPLTPPSAEPPRGPVRTREDGCDGYHQALAQVGTPGPNHTPGQEPTSIPPPASTGYQLTRRALLEDRGRTRHP